MKLKYTLAGVALLLLTGIAFYPVTKHENITINVPLQKVYNLLNSPAGWRNWYGGTVNNTPENTQAASKEFTMRTAQGTIKVSVLDALIWDVENNGDDYLVALLPQKFDNKTVVRVTYRTGLLNSLIPYKKEWSSKENLLNNLKDYLENPAKYYGVTFIKAGTQDLDIVVYRNTVKRSLLLAEIKKGLKAVDEQIGGKDTTRKNNIYLQEISDKTTVTLFIGISVKKKPNHMLPGFEYMHLQASKALVVNYSGKFNGIAKVYEGISNYENDHYVRPRMQPIEKYDRANLPLNDTTHVEAQIIFPIQ